MDAESWELADGTTLEYSEFVSYIEDAMDRMPPQFASSIENVAFLALAEPDENDFERLELSNPGRDFSHGEILGLHSGVPITRITFKDEAEPSVIKIFAGPLSRYCQTKEELKEQVYRTLVHEVAHYFGMSDPEIRAMGY